MRAAWVVLCLCWMSLWIGCASVAPESTSAPVSAPVCENDRLTDFDDLLILAPHPDDEILGFTGLADAFQKAGKPVEVWVVTDGDAYCEACRLWTTGSIDGAVCDAETLSNLNTSEVDSLAEVRRLESTEAARVLGRPAPKFLGYPDTGLAAAWRNEQAGERSKRLRRSDFSQCSDCRSCGSGYGGGPEIELTAGTLIESLSKRLKKTSPRTLIGTTHWLDSHGDHSALGNFVRRLVSDLPGNRAVAYAVIHAHTTNGYGMADCWYPGPAAEICACLDDQRADADPNWLSEHRGARFQPNRPQVLPTDTDYGEPVQFCFGPEVLEGTGAKKLQAIQSFRTQLGTEGREPGLLPEARRGLLDCTGYLTSFVRSTEVFVLEDGR